MNAVQPYINPYRVLSSEEPGELPTYLTLYLLFLTPKTFLKPLCNTPTTAEIQNWEHRDL